MTDTRFGAPCRNQYGDGKSLFEAGVRADQTGYGTLWTCAL
jgi:hypothetical protein